MAALKNKLMTLTAVHSGKMTKAIAQILKTAALNLLNWVEHCS